MTLLLRRGAVAFARSPARHGRHQHRREKNDHLPRYRGPRSGVRPVARAVAGCGVADEPNDDTGLESLEVGRIAVSGRCFAAMHAEGSHILSRVRAELDDQTELVRLRDYLRRCGCLAFINESRSLDVHPPRTTLQATQARLL